MTTFEVIWFWGCFGMMTEILFTSIRKLIAKSPFSKKEWALIGHTSVWMFPVYSLGLGYGFDFIIWLIDWDIVRWLSYPFWIWAVEILISSLTKRWDFELWSFSYLPGWAHWKGIISYVHYPAWVLFGIVVETIK